MRRRNYRALAVCWMRGGLLPAWVVTELDLKCPLAVPIRAALRPCKAAAAVPRGVVRQAEDALLDCRSPEGPS